MNSLLEIFNNVAGYFPWFMLSMVVAVITLSLLPIMGKLLGNISLKEELSHKDNFAAGYSVAGAIFALGAIIAGASSGDFGDTFIHEATLTLSFALSGLILLLAARFIFDKLSLRKINLHDEIIKENSAAGIADFGNTVASSLILFSVMVWVDSTEYIDIIWLFAAWIVSQVILFLATVYRNLIQSKFGGKICIQEQLKKGNEAVAIRFAGFRIAIAISVMATTKLVSFDFEHIFETFLTWFLVSIIFAALTTFFGLVLRKIILKGINVWSEVEEQKNNGIAAIQSSIYIVVSLIILGINL